MMHVDVLRKCPECSVGHDPLYGWDPLVRWHYVEWNIAPLAIVKEQCFGCGYHKAYLTPIKETEECNLLNPVWELLKKCRRPEVRWFAWWRQLPHAG